MKAMRVKQFGDPDVMVMEEIEVPVMMNGFSAYWQSLWLVLWFQ